MRMSSEIPTLTRADAMPVDWKRDRQIAQATLVNTALRVFTG
jgi:hypothetical protein